MRCIPKTQTAGNHVSMHAYVKQNTRHLGAKLMHRHQERKKQINRNESSETQSRTCHHAQHKTGTKSAFLHISIRAGSSPQLLMWQQRDHEKYPLWWSWLLTELTTLSSQSDHSREAYCYMRGLVLMKTQQQKGLWNLNTFPVDGL